jgi:cytochrome c oxidase subunit 2
MEKPEKRWLILLVAVAVTFNALTLSPLIPWQEWNLWSSPVPDKSYRIDFEDYEIKLPAGGIDFQAGEFVEFIATSQDVTYGFGVFRHDGTIVFQMQVLPGRENTFLWKFTEPGLYDVRSTEYSGPRHPEMFIKDAIRVSQ